jgi:hypothetical protein
MSMPILKNPRHEAFAQELAKGKTADEAYQAVGYRADRGHASRLAANGNICVRLAELQAVGAEKAVVTIESLIAKAEAARAAGANGTDWPIHRQATGRNLWAMDRTPPPRRARIKTYPKWPRQLRGGKIHALARKPSFESEIRCGGNDEPAARRSSG